MGVGLNCLSWSGCLSRVLVDISVIPLCIGWDRAAARVSFDGYLGKQSSLYRIHIPYHTKQNNKSHGPSFLLLSNRPSAYTALLSYHYHVPSLYV